MKALHLTFVCSISNVFDTPAEKKVIRKIEESCGAIEIILYESEWNPPIEYIKEIGQNLQTRIYILKERKNISEIEAIKDVCIKLEKETEKEGNRTFNLNPGFLSDDGMFLLTHKPNDSRQRKKLERYWIEQQYDYKPTVGYIENNLTFSEYRGKRLVEFSERFGLK